MEIWRASSCPLLCFLYPKGACLSVRIVTLDVSVALDMCATQEKTDVVFVPRLIHYRFCKMHFLSLEMHFRLPRRNAFSKSHYNASLRNALFEEWRNALFYGCLLMHYFTAFY